MTVTLDTMTDSEYSEDENGPRVTRAGLVTGLSSIAADRWLWTARNLSGVPAYGQYHPVVPGARALQFSIKPVNNDSAQIIVIYSRITGAEQAPAGDDAASANEAQISMGATMVQVETQKDRTGAPLAVEYANTEINSAGTTLRLILPNIAKILPEGAQPNGDVYIEGRQIHAASVDVPHGILRFTRRENDPPLLKSLEYTGHVNSSRIWGGAPRTWLCLPIEGTSDDGGATYVVDYAFEYNPETWDQDIIWIDPDTGAPHKDIDFAKVGELHSGVARYQIRPLADFSRLYLTVPDL